MIKLINYYFFHLINCECILKLMIDIKSLNKDNMIMTNRTNILTCDIFVGVTLILLMYT